MYQALPDYLVNGINILIESHKIIITSQVSEKRHCLSKPAYFSMGNKKLKCLESIEKEC